jgi:ABC-2 type transport system permease protein
LLVGVSMLDWKNDAERFVLSLPVTRATAVKARYATAVLIGLASLAVGALVGLSRALVMTARGQPWPRWMAADVGLAFVFVFAFIVAIYLPCYFQWGYGKGVVAAALVLASTIVGSDVLGPFVVGTAVRDAAAGDDLPRGVVAHGAALLASRHGLAAAGVVVLGAAAVMLWLSAQASMRAYQRREF